MLVGGGGQHAEGVGPGPQPGGDRRRVLVGAGAGDHLGGDAGGDDQVEQGDLVGDPLPRRAQLLVAGGEHREPGGEVLGLAGWEFPGEHDGDRRVLDLLRSDEQGGAGWGGRALGGEDVESGAEAGEVVAEDDGPGLQRGPTGAQRPRHRVRVDVGGGVEGVPQPRGLRAHSVGGAGGHRPHRGGRGGGGGGGRGGSGCLFEDQVHVGAAEAEGGHRSAPGAVPGWPRCRLGEQAQRPGAPVDAGGGPLGVPGAGQGSLPQCHDHREQARHARGGLGVAQHRLDRAHVQRVVPVPPVGGLEGVGLDGVPQRGAGAVRLDGVDGGPG